MIINPIAPIKHTATNLNSVSIIFLLLLILCARYTKKAPANKMINALRLPDAITINKAGNEKNKLHDMCLFMILEKVITNEYAAIIPIALTFAKSLSIRLPAWTTNLIVANP